jgi:cysteine desulfuration protein SufE
VDIEDIKSSFGFFDDWEDKYRFIIDLGKELPNFATIDKTAERLVRGCQSQVWLISEFDGDNDLIKLRIDSDAHIVRGLIAIVLAVYDRRSPAFIAEFNIDGLFEELDLLQHLSATRGNGLRAMVAKVRSLAQAAADTG